MDNLQIPSGPSRQLKCEVVLFLPELLTSSTLTDANSSPLDCPLWRAGWAQEVQVGLAGTVKKEEGGEGFKSQVHTTAHRRLLLSNSEFLRPVAGHALPLPCSGKCGAQD